MIEYSPQHWASRMPVFTIFALPSTAPRHVCGSEGLHHVGSQLCHRGLPHVMWRPRLLLQQRPAGYLRGVHSCLHLRGRKHSHDAADCQVPQHTEMHYHKPEYLIRGKWRRTHKSTDSLIMFGGFMPINDTQSNNFFVISRRTRTDATTQQLPCHKCRRHSHTPPSAKANTSHIIHP